MTLARDRTVPPAASSPALGRRLVAEAIGTALLVVFGAGALVAALEPGQGKLDDAGIGIVALSFSLVIAAAVYTMRLLAEHHSSSIDL